MDDNFLKIMTLLLGAITTLGMGYLAYLTAQIKTQTDGMASRLGEAKFAEGQKATQDQLLLDQAADARLATLMSAAVTAALAKHAPAPPLVKANGDAIPVVPAPATVVPPT